MEKSNSSNWIRQLQKKDEEAYDQRLHLAQTGPYQLRRGQKNDGYKAVLQYGTEEGNITENEAETALTTLQSFLSSHPDHIFLSSRERYKHGVEESAEEVDLWTTIQPILDKAQGDVPNEAGAAKNKIKK